GSRPPMSAKTFLLPTVAMTFLVLLMFTSPQDVGTAETLESLHGVVRSARLGEPKCVPDPILDALRKTPKVVPAARDPHDGLRGRLRFQGPDYATYSL